MRKYSSKYIQWIKHQNKRKIRKRIKKSLKKKIKLQNKNKKNKFQIIEAPKHLSLIDNPEDTIKYFNDAIDILQNPSNKNKVGILLFDCKYINDLSIDALMYLLAIVKNFKKRFSGIREIRGNLPDNKIAREFFIESGFLKFVNTNVNNSEKKNKLQILTGSNVDVKDAAKLVDFVTNYYNCDKKEIKFLYKMVIELMTNTHNHAYNSNDNLFIKSWYLFAAVNDVTKSIEITFVDIGEGIPKTVSKSTLEKFFRKTDNEYIISTLNGEFRTQTKEKNRGKGLPDIYEHYKNNQIQNLKIISCKGKVELEKEKSLEESGVELINDLQGTVFYWEINLRKEMIK